MHRMLIAACCLGLAACAAAGASRPPAAHAAAGRWSNAFGYCRAVGTIDAPDDRYTGPEPPPAVVAGLMKILGLVPAAGPAVAGGMSWRCMDGAVYACTVGANLPCSEKAVTSREPTAAETAYCRAHPGAGFIPLYVTGHATVYAWSCRDTDPTISATVAQADARGYVAGIWHRIPPPEPRRKAGGAT